MMNKTFKNNENNKLYNVAIYSETNNTVILENKTDNEILSYPLDVFNELITSGAYSEAAQSKIKLAKKCDKQSTAEKIAIFAKTLLGCVESETDYIIKREDAKANKFLLVYVNPTTKKFRNLAELFIKVRANTLDTFIREEEIASGLDYNRTLAETHKAHNYNFWIEYSVRNEEELIKATVKQLISNHKATLTA